MAIGENYLEKLWIAVKIILKIDFILTLWNNNNGTIQCIFTDNINFT